MLLCCARLAGESFNQLGRDREYARYVDFHNSNADAAFTSSSLQLPTCRIFPLPPSLEEQHQASRLSLFSQ